MAAGAPNQARWNPGRLVFNPTQNPATSGATYPFGGVEVGLVRALEADETYDLNEEIAEEHGSARVAHDVTGRQAFLTCIMRGFDSSGVSYLPDGAVGAIAALVEDGGFDGGAISGIKVLVCPDSVALGQKTVAQCTDLGYALYDAALLPKASEKIRMQYGEEIGTPVVFIGRPDSYGNLFQRRVLSAIGGLLTAALDFTTEPGNANVGATFSAVVKAFDTDGAVDTAFTGNVTVALTTPGGATLGGTLTKACVAGVATFSDLTVDTAGTYTLTAMATGYSSTASASFTISTP